MAKWIDIASERTKDFFPTTPDLVDMLGRMDLDFENFVFFYFLDRSIWISRSPDLQISGFPGPQIYKFPDSQISRFPDFQAPPAPDELSDPNLSLLPTHPGIKYVARALAATYSPLTGIFWQH